MNYWTAAEQRQQGEKNKARQKTLLGLLGVHIRVGECLTPSLEHKLVLPASRGGFVGACRFKQGAVQRATLEEERGVGAVLWVGTETCRANTGLVDRNSGRRLTTSPKGRRKTGGKKIERKQVSCCFGQRNSGWSMPNSLNRAPFKSSSFSCPMSKVGRWCAMLMKRLLYANSLWWHWAIRTKLRPAKVPAKNVEFSILNP